MRKTTIRLSDRLWGMVQAAAEREGITGSQYIREAVIARVFYEQGLRGAAFGPPSAPGEATVAAGSQPRGAEGSL